MHHMRKTETQFAKREVAGGSFLNTLVNNLPLEVHFPGHSFTGPGTKLHERLNSNGKSKEWSMPKNRIDDAAHHHDICYSKHIDTKTKNDVCDKSILNELAGTMNPTLRERINK